MQTAILPVVFLKALSNQSSETIEAVSVNQDARQGVVAALDSVEAQTKACSTGVRVENITIIGTPTLSTNSSIYRISLEILLILRPGELTPLLRQVLSQYGKVLHVGILLDPATNLFFGKGYHVKHLDKYCLIMTSWKSIEKHCFYCHKPGHTKRVFPKLKNRRAKTCYTCGNPEHLFKDCPKHATVSIEYKRHGTDHVERPIVEEHQGRITRSTRKSRPSAITVGDFIQPYGPDQWL